jgi:hypothetical protein
MRFERTWPGHLAASCPHVNPAEIEWLSQQKVAAIPYGLPIRTCEGVRPRARQLQRVRSIEEDHS